MTLVLWSAVVLDVLHRCADRARRRAVPGTLARAQAATRQVLLAPGPIGLPLAWLVFVLGIDEPVVRAVVIALGGPLMAFGLWLDVRALRQAWAESRFPGDMDRLRTKVAALRGRLAAAPGGVVPAGA
ncbi:hypothetical protein [Cellulosimicrobium sp. Marseille-Q4280]|uniref:hypothetical protein n=1 Tax=Cellulosimicrobium sp. Marseille-Q4280 TaxID=2937992 RepID=UPI002041C226|nr:hypothetical protein [Cellulosimicrobium sp. Marseille-Q4280]